MKFLSFLYEEKEDYGVLLSDETGVLPMKTLLDQLDIPTPGDLLGFIRSYGDSLQERLAAKAESSTHLALSLPDVELLAPIPYPRRNVFCVGKNYLDHATEIQAEGINADVPTSPIYFTKVADPAIGQYGTTTIPTGYTNAFDYEVELAVIIGKDGKNIPSDQAFDYIFGYTIGNDISARDLQVKHGQWFKGKSLDGTTALGPYIVSTSEIETPPELGIICKINGEIRQNSNTKMFIFDIPTIISDLSKGLTLRAGDIILTGTPAGVAMGMNPPKYLKAGDKIESSIEKIGSLINFVDEELSK